MFSRFLEMFVVSEMFGEQLGRLGSEEVMINCFIIVVTGWACRRVDKIV